LAACDRDPQQVKTLRNFLYNDRHGTMCFPSFDCTGPLLIPILILSSCVWKAEIDNKGKRYELKEKKAPFFDELRDWTLKYDRLCGNRDTVQKHDLKVQV
jgi:hypothetical protein